MTHRHAFIVASALLVAGACQDHPIAEPPEVQEQPEVLEAVALGAEIATAIQSNSTICRAFRAQLLEFRTQLVERPEELELRTAGATLEGIITHTCD
jgi:hypothetical protein